MSRTATLTSFASPTEFDAPAVEVSNLRKEFVRRDRRRGFARKRHLAALKDISLRIERGECVAILGQNGSGKSTLVRLLSTLLLADGGSAKVFGYDVFSEPRPVRRLINRVSVEASFFKKMSSVENLSYAARFYGMPASKTRAEIPAILERVGFPADRRNDSMENLSRGMQQKVSSCCWTNPQRASTRVPSSRCRTSFARCGPRTTPPFCCALTIWLRRSRLRSASASSTAASCSLWNRQTS